jgi:hypothetical protein
MSGSLAGSRVIPLLSDEKKIRYMEDGHVGHLLLLLYDAWIASRYDHLVDEDRCEGH